MKITVTGATGFIGTHLVTALIEAGHEVACAVRNPSEAATRLPAQAKAIPMEGMLAGRYPFPKADALFHLAAIRHRWGVSEEEYDSANVGLTRRLLDLSYGRIEHFIYCSSISVFGWPRKGPIDESYPYAPVNCYGKSKARCEGEVLNFRRRGGLKTTIIRPSITYGRSDPTGMMTKLGRMIDRGTYRTVGSGENRVQLAHVKDIVQGFMKALGNPNAFGRAYIITAPTPIRINQLVELVAREIGSSAPKLRIPLPLAYVAAMGLEVCYASGWKVTGRDPIITRERIQIMTIDRHYSIARAQDEIGYAPEYDYASGIKDFIQGLRQDGLLRGGKA